MWLTAIAWIANTFLLLVAWQSPLYNATWDSVRSIIPLVTLVGCVLLLRRKRTDTEEKSKVDDDLTVDQPMTVGAPSDRTLFLLLSMAAMVSLVQFPYSFAIYFCYAIPLGILATSAIVQRQSFAPTHLHLSVAVFYFGFAGVWLNHSRVQRMGTQFVYDDQDTVLDLPRCGLRVSEGQANLYEKIVEEIWRHSEENSFIYAAMDCPEIYFLSQRKNPTRSFYEFFEEDYSGDPDVRAKRIDTVLDDHDVNVVVLHWQGEFSGGFSYELSQLIAAQYPNVAHFVRDPSNQPDVEPVFSVAWREPSP